MKHLIAYLHVSIMSLINLVHRHLSFQAQVASFPAADGG